MHNHIVQSMIDAARKAKWKRVSDLPLEVSRTDSRIFESFTDGWKFVIADFSIEDQGFPKGARGSDGMASSRKDLVMLRLPRGMAEALIVEALVQTLMST